MYYLVKWCSLPYEDSTWELKDDVDQSKIEEFEQLQAAKPDSRRVVSKTHQHSSLTIIFQRFSPGACAYLLVFYCCLYFEVLISAVYNCRGIFGMKFFTAPTNIRCMRKLLITISQTLINILKMKHLLPVTVGLFLSEDIF